MVRSRPRYIDFGFSWLLGSCNKPLSLFDSLALQFTTDLRLTINCADYEISLSRLKRKGKPQSCGLAAVGGEPACPAAGLSRTTSLSSTRICFSTRDQTCGSQSIELCALST